MPWGARQPPWPPLPPQIGSEGAGPPSPLPLYICGGWEGSRTQVLAQPPLFHVLLPSRCAWRSPARLPRSSITTTPSCCCWTESSPTSPSLLAGSRRGRRHRAARVLNAEAPFFRCLDRNQPRSESLRVRLPHPRSCNASASRSTRVCRFTPLPLVARLLHRLFLVMRRKF